MATLRQQWTELSEAYSEETPELRLLSTHTGESLVPALGIALADREVPRRITTRSYVAAPAEISALARDEDCPADVVLVADFEGLFGPAPDDGSLSADLGRLRDALADLAGAGSDVFVTLPPVPRDMDGADRLHGGRLHHWYRCGAELLAAAAAIPHLHVVDLPSLLMRQDGPVTDDRMWYLAMQPFSAAVLQDLGVALAAAVAAVRRPPMKVLVADCDGVLWGGVLGEDGPDQIKLGGGDPIGRAFEATQRYLVRLARRGVLVALCSKNKGEDVWSVVDTHPGMVLSRSDIAAARINWMPKSQNIAEIAAELNVLPDSIVFIDDSPAEIAEVTARLPACRSVRLPSDPVAVPAFLAGQNWFDAATITDEDRARVTMMAAESERRHHADTRGGEDYLADLGLEVTVGAIDERTIPRVTQLLGKTNQFNTAVHRHDESAVRALVGTPDWLGLTFTVSDRFGGYGLTGVAIAGPREGRMVIDSFLLSCRVLGRGVEDFMLTTIGEHAQALGLDTVAAVVTFTDRNVPARDFLKRRGFTPADGSCQTLPAELAATSAPAHLTVSGPDLARP